MIVVHLISLELCMHIWMWSLCRTFSAHGSTKHCDNIHNVERGRGRESGKKVCTINVLSVSISIHNLCMYGWSVYFGFSRDCKLYNCIYIVSPHLRSISNEEKPGMHSKCVEHIFRLLFPFVVSRSSLFKNKHKSFKFIRKASSCLCVPMPVQFMRLFLCIFVKAFSSIHFGTQNEFNVSAGAAAAGNVCSIKMARGKK